MTNADLLREARKLDAEATPGPWLASEYLDDGRIGILTASNRIVVALRSGVLDEQDAAFIARARTLLPQPADALEAAVRAVESEGQFYKAAVADLAEAEARLAKGWEAPIEVYGMAGAKGV